MKCDRIPAWGIGRRQSTLQNCWGSGQFRVVNESRLRPNDWTWHGAGSRAGAQTQ
jgi:hypothetical protein